MPPIQLLYLFAWRGVVHKVQTTGLTKQCKTGKYSNEKKIKVRKDNKSTDDDDWLPF